jgi:hypothetical protein
MEMHECPAVASGALGKYRDPVANCQRLADMLVYSGGVAAFRALNE